MVAYHWGMGMPEPERCRDWAAIIRAFDLFLPPKVPFGSEGSVGRETWVFHAWCRLFQIPATELGAIERKLFQMNIHDLALFPDVEGLAGFMRQKIHFTGSLMRVRRPRQLWRTIGA